MSHRRSAAMLHALRDRTAANAIFIARICRGVTGDLASAASPASQSSWHQNGLRSLQIAARACFEHGTPSAAASASRPSPPQPALGADAGRHAQPGGAPVSSRAAPSPIRAGMALNFAPILRQFRTGAAHGAAAAVAEPVGAETASGAAASAHPVQQRAASGVPLPPWTPTDQRQKRKTLPKRMGFMLLELEKERMLQEGAAKKLPEFGPGDSLELKLSVPENRRRVAIVKGTCIAKRNRGWRTSFTIRNHIGGAGGIERTFPLYSPHIQEITVLTQKKVRRAKLYYLRDRVPKEYRV